MATGVMRPDEFPKFRAKAVEVAGRYELWVTETEMALVPCVTSKNVHTYIIPIEGQKKEDVEDLIKNFKGRVIYMDEILVDKW